MIKIERKVLVNCIYDSYSADRAQRDIQYFLDDEWLIEHTEHTDKSIIVFLYKEIGCIDEQNEEALNCYVGEKS